MMPTCSEGNLSLIKLVTSAMYSMLKNIKGLHVLALQVLVHWWKNWTIELGLQVVLHVVIDNAVLNSLLLRALM